MDLTEEELVPLGRAGRQVPVGIAAVALLLVVAIAKPWDGQQPMSSPAPATPHIVTVATAATTPPARIPVPSPGDWDNTVCTSPDGWRVVADDVELGRSVRSWLVASVAYSFVPPIATSIPFTLVVSGSLNRLGFCIPQAVLEHGEIGWSGTLWRQGADAAGQIGWLRVAVLTPAPGSLGAVADRLDGSAGLWPPGTYVMEARFAGSLTEAWLGLAVKATP